MYKEFKGLNLPEIDKELLEFWTANKVFEKSVEQRDPNNPFVFVEGPPSANGKPGIHHVIARTIKDIFCRFHTMKGERVERKGGWDTHGLPVELAVEKELGITKEDIGKTITVEDYNKKCRETVMRYKDIWDDITRKMGYWVDLNDPYITFENNYIESVWHLLSTLYKKDMIYKGYTIQPYSPAAGTGLSSHEVNQPGCYQDVTDTTVVAQFKAIADTLPDFLSGKGDVHFLAWTTTPWTLPSNTALTVGPKIEYVLVQTFNEYTHQPTKVILAKALVGKQFGGKYAEAEDSSAFSGYEERLKQPDVKAGKIPFQILESFKGSDLLGIRYEQLLPYTQPADNPENAFRVILGNFVTTEDGTGIVHTAPTFGADDAMVAKQADPPVPPMLVRNEKDKLVPLVDLQGKFRPEMGEFAGAFVKNQYYNKGEAPDKSMDVQLAIKLKTENKAFKVEKYVHSYPHCWRTDKPVLYYPLDSWFIRTTAAKDRMIELNNTINWKPSHTGEKRFGNWLENLQDWNLSRSRFWGIPLPIWRTKDNEYEKCIGSMEELQKEIDAANSKLGKNQSLPEDLHRPYIDNVILVAENGEPMYRETDLIDVWFDSGAAPYAQWHYPFENQEKFKKNFPADFISEGVDQTRGWFFTLHAIGAMTQDSVAYKNVLSTGLVLDKHGKKMSKRLGNAVDPFETISKYGADATRWYMISNAQPWDNLKFDVDGIEEVKRKFFGTLYNTYSFFSMYANIDKFTFSEDRIPVKDRPEIDRWIMSELNTLIKHVEKNYAEYEPTNATRLIQSFVDEHLSNWYVRLCRRRFWKGEYEADKISAYQTLYECMNTIAKLMSPVSPFFSDWLFRNLNGATNLENHISVHLTDFPEVETAAVDTVLQEKMDYAQRISSLVLSLRKKESIRVRQPLQKILLPVLNDSFKTKVEGVKDLILAEVNVKDIEYIEQDSSFIKKKVKANFKTLGRTLGKNMKAASALINEFTQEDIATIEKTGAYQLTIDGQAFDLKTEDFIITSEDIPGWLVATDRNLTVALDVTTTDALLAEGVARDLVKIIQNIRRDKGFNITDKIAIAIENHEAIRPAVEQFGDYICNETLATELLKKDGLTVEKVALSDEVALGIDVGKA